MPIELDPKSTAAFAGRLKNAVDRAPIEPRVDPRKRLVFPAKEGVELDLDGTVKRIANALGSGARDVDAVLVHIPTRIAPSAWAKLDMRAVLGEFETRYQPVSVSADRTDPLKKLASKIDGYVLEPGALFDFNDVVLGGATDKSLQRPTADREWVDGACQIASTLHAALFFAGLPILLRYPQSRPSFYIKLGLDAAVGDTERDLRFQNDRSYPIVIGLRVDDGRVYASIHGPARDHSVQFIRHIDTVMPFEERIVRDASLPGGLRVLAQRGMPGFKITRYRIVTDEVSHVSVRERTRDIYPPTPQLWRIGTGREPPPDFERPRNDAHPEYVADEYLQMTQTEAGTFDVARDIGRTGSYGWIAREGMLVHKE
jgi:vancomycin resistance protein YoaR